MNPLRTAKPGPGRWFVFVVFAATDAGTAGEPYPVPASYKLEIDEFGVGTVPMISIQLLSHEGRIYRISTEIREEVLVYDPALARIDLLDLKRRMQSELSLKLIEQGTARRRRSIEQAAAKREHAGGRANEVAAALSRDLVDPRFEQTFDAKMHRVFLKNPTVEGYAVGTSESDRARLSQIGQGLKVLLELDSLRDPQAIPPFSQLSALTSLIEEHELRPSELSFLFRIAGKPKRRRWTYRLVPELSARDIEAIARINDFRARTGFVRFDRYEFPDKADQPPNP